MAGVRYQPDFAPFEPRMGYLRIPCPLGAPVRFGCRSQGRAQEFQLFGRRMIPHGQWAAQVCLQRLQPVMHCLRGSPKFIVGGMARKIVDRAIARMREITTRQQVPQGLLMVGHEVTMRQSLHAPNCLTQCRRKNALNRKKPAQQCPPRWRSLGQKPNSETSN